MSDWLPQADDHVMVHLTFRGHVDATVIDVKPESRLAKVAFDDAAPMWVSFDGLTRVQQ